MILAIDPGKEKCGLALADDAGEIVEKLVVKRTDSARAVAARTAEVILIGDSAYGQAVKAELPAGAPVLFIPEQNSTREARVRYWQANPPRGLWRMVPTSFRFPPVPVDDYAAVILIERYLRSLSLSPV